MLGQTSPMPWVKVLRDMQLRDSNFMQFRKLTKLHNATSNGVWRSSKINWDLKSHDIALSFSKYIHRPPVKQRSRTFVLLSSFIYMKCLASYIYHLCPSNTSLPVDTVVITWLMVHVILTIYAMRHPHSSFNLTSAVHIFTLALAFEVSWTFFPRIWSAIFFFQSKSSSK